MLYWGGDDSVCISPQVCVLSLICDTEYAAAFFLLADRLKDAVGILAGQLDDIQLAVAVARVYEGDDGPVLKGLLEERILPRALQTGDRWLAHWAFSMLARHDDATKCLVVSLPDAYTIRPSPLLTKSLSFHSRHPSISTSTTLYPKHRRVSSRKIRRWSCSTNTSVTLHSVRYTTNQPHPL